jgi:tRNA(adenine34) deaminase
MCSGAMLHARVDRVVFGAADPKSGGVTTPMALYTQPQLHHKPLIEGGVLADDCAKLLQDFFKLKRAKAT